jgi:hypothetical protein
MTLGDYIGISMVPIPHDNGGIPDLSNREILRILKMAIADWLHEMQCHTEHMQQDTRTPIPQNTLVQPPIL